MQKFSSSDWLPTSVKEMKALGWTEVDVILFSGDAYIDHPSFGPAVIARWLQHLGLKVAVVPQPNCTDDLRDFKKFGVPRLFFAVSAGNMDSMINHYTANRRKRSDDAFTPGGRAGARPDYAVTAYTQILKKNYPNIPVIIGGIEASLRRVTHYDYWSDTLKPSVLIESGADLLVYGMGEKPLKTLVQRLQKDEPLTSLRDIPQTAFVVNQKQKPDEKEFMRTITMLSFEKCRESRINYARNFKIIEEESNRDDAARLLEPCGKKIVVINPPYVSYSQDEIDEPYSLPYTRMPHPRYQGKESIPAYDMIRDSVNIHRGCFGGCSFCTISAHQGKHILSRSEESVLEEVKKVVETPGFHGNLSDLGGPSANMYRMEGSNKQICAKCRRASCIYPSVCKNLNASHKPVTEIYQKVSALPGIKRVFIGSGVRYDLFYGLHNPEHEKQAREYFRELVLKHVSGRLKVAPEHNAPHVLKIMRKPSFDLFLRLRTDFDAICRKAGIKQQVIPYLISSHPGSTACDMAELAAELRRIGYFPEQVQDFTPTPMTLSSAIFCTGVDPYTLKPVFTALSPSDKKDQQRFFFYYKPENRNEIRQQLMRMKRSDLLNILYGKGKNTSKGRF
ncbi:MAG: YgiQ family radical SAM protein [Bacteroidota bacterium]|nr:YgiQ family radical SAM protein [Bacteroidota bacterium]